MKMKKMLMGLLSACCFFCNMTAVIAEEADTETTNITVQRLPIPDSIKATGSTMGHYLQPTPTSLYVTQSYNGHNYAGNIPFDHKVEYDGIWVAYYEGYIYLVS